MARAGLVIVALASVGALPATADPWDAKVVVGTAATADSQEPGYALTIDVVDLRGVAGHGHVAYTCCGTGGATIDIDIDCVETAYSYEGSPLVWLSGVAEDTRYYVFLIDEYFEMYGSDRVAVSTTPRTGAPCEAGSDDRLARASLIAFP